jgi:hypothetical protein
MIELRLIISESKILYFWENNGNTKNNIFISNNGLLKKSSRLTVICIVKVQKLKPYSCSMLTTRTFSTDSFPPRLLRLRMCIATAYACISRSYFFGCRSPYIWLKQNPQYTRCGITKILLFALFFKRKESCLDPKIEWRSVQERWFWMWEPGAGSSPSLLTSRVPSGWVTHIEIDT